MREIKYRAWHYNDGMMLDWGLIKQSAFNRDGYSLIYDAMTNRGRFDIMQYTGLKDKNGKEIYEGDILSFFTSKSWGFAEDGKQVILKPVEFGRFCIRQNSLYAFNGFHIDDSSIEYNLTHGAFVIGNIYENPDLLK